MSEAGTGAPRRRGGTAWQPSIAGVIGQAGAGGGNGFSLSLSSPSLPLRTPIPPLCETAPGGKCGGGEQTVLHTAGPHGSTLQLGQCCHLRAHTALIDRASWLQPSCSGRGMEARRAGPCGEGLCVCVGRNSPGLWPRGRRQVPSLPGSQCQPQRPCPGPVPGQPWVQGLGMGSAFAPTPWVPVAAPHSFMGHRF